MEKAESSYMKDRRRQNLLLTLLYIGCLTLIGLPLISLFVNHFEWGGNILGNGMALDAIRVSLSTTALTLCIVILIGTPMAYASARIDFKGKEYIDLLLSLPLVLPPAVAGLLLLMTFGKNGWIGHHLYELGIKVPFSFVAVILAQLFVALPMYIKTGAEGFKKVPIKMEMTAMTLGDTRLKAFIKVTLPLAKETLLTGGILAWARALAEFGATIMFAGNLRGKTQTLPLAIYTAMESDMGTALSIARIMVFVSIGILIMVSILSKRRNKYAKM